MKKHNLIALTAAATLLSGCIPSLNPFYAEKDVIFDARLVGDWKPKQTNEPPDIWKFEKGEDKAYKLLITEKEAKTGEFSAHLFRLEGQYFLDLRPSKCDYATNQIDLVSVSMFPGHLLVRVTKFEPELELAFLDFDWLQKHLEKKPSALLHQKEDNAILLTAKTMELQRFVLDHLREGELFAKPEQLSRKSP